MAVSEDPRIIKWLYDTLHTLATGGAFQDVAPDGAIAPYIVYGFMSPRGTGDQHVFGGVRALTDNLYQAKVVAPNGMYATLLSIADAMDAALQGAHSVSLSNGVVMMRSLRSRQIDQSEGPYNGVMWVNLGAVWAIMARS